MSKVRILIVEDELIVAEELSMQLTKLGFDVLDYVTNVLEAKRALEVYQLDIVLIDIKLKGEEDGISLGTFITKEYCLPFIFTTSFTDDQTVQSASKARPSAYLIKPYNYKELQIAIEIALSNFENKYIASQSSQTEKDSSHYLVNGQVFIKDNGRFERLQYHDIYWLKAENSYVSIHTPKKQFLITSDTLGSFLEKIKIPELIRIHRSYAVNISKVKAFEGNQVYIDDYTFPIGKNYRMVLKECFNIL